MSFVAWAPVLEAQPAPIVSIRFQGNANIEESRLRAGLRLSREGNLYSPEALKFELQQVEKLYRDAGFLEALVGPPQVSHRNREGGASGVSILIPVEEGPVYRLGTLSIDGAEVIERDTFLQMSPLRSGQTYRRGLVREWIEKIKLSYEEIGHIRFDARVQEHTNASDHTVDCVLEFQEGNPYRIGKISVTNDAVNPVEFKKQLLVGEGGLFNPDMLAYTIQYLNLRRAYQPIGPSDVEVKIDDTAHKVDLVFQVTPLKKPSSGPRPSSGGPAPGGGRGR